MAKRNLYFVIALAAALAGCKTVELSTQTVNAKMPSAYTADPVASDSALPGWRKMFFDSSLATIIDSALKNNFDLKIALQKIESARSQITLSKGIRLPEVNANAGAGLRRFGHYTMDGIGNYDTRFSPNLSDNERVPDPYPDYYIGFQAAWEIDLWGKLKQKKKAAALRFIASEYGRDLIITNLVAEIAYVYFELLALDNEMQILEENIELQQSALDLVTAQKHAGKTNELAVELLHAQLLNSKAIKADVQQQLVEQESKLSFLCGAYPGNIERDSSLFSPHISDGLAAGIPSDLLQNRPDIRMAEKLLHASNADVKSATLAFYPSFNISSAMGMQSFNAMLLLDPASLAYNVFGGLTSPIFNRRKLKAELMSAKAEQRQAYIEYEKSVVNSFKEVYVGINNISNSRQMYELKKQEAEMLKKSVSTSVELYKAGRANYLEVITAQKNALQAQMELTAIYKRLNFALIDLYKSLGGGWK